MCAAMAIGRWWLIDAGVVDARFVSMVDAEHAFHASDDAADGAAHHRTDRAGAAAPFVHPVRDASGHALRMGGDRHETRCQEYARSQYTGLHGFSLLWLTGAVSWPIGAIRRLHCGGFAQGARCPGGVAKMKQRAARRWLPFLFFPGLPWWCAGNGDGVRGEVAVGYATEGMLWTTQSPTG